MTRKYRYHCPINNYVTMSSVSQYDDAITLKSHSKPPLQEALRKERATKTIHEYISRKKKEGEQWDSVVVNYYGNIPNCREWIPQGKIAAMNIAMSSMERQKPYRKKNDEQPVPAPSASNQTMTSNEVASTHETRGIF